MYFISYAFIKMRSNYNVTSKLLAHEVLAVCIVLQTLDC